MIFKLALRNALRHGKSSLLILFFMTVVGMVFMGGNSLLVSVNRALRDGFREHITADGVIMAPTKEPMSLFGAAVPSIGEFFSLPSLKNKAELEELVAQTTFLASSTPLVSGNALMDAQSYSRGISFFGIDRDSYFALFPDTDFPEGPVDFSGTGVLVPESLADEWEKETGTPLKKGDFVKFTTAGDIGFTIRLVEVKGIYRSPYSHPLIDSLVLMDDRTARDLVRVLADQTKDSSPEEASDLLDRDLDSLFGETEDFSTGEGEDILSSLTALFSESLPELEGESSGSWHFLLVRFTDSRAYRRRLKKLESLLVDYPVQVLSWREAAGASATYAWFMQLFFYGGFFLIFLAGVLGIVNIMLISLFQRTVEIGTIQALGGTTRFVRSLLSLEYLSLSLAGGLLSLILSGGLFTLLNDQGILLDNRILNMVFGGKPLYFPFTPGLALVNLAVCLLTGWLSSLYPIGKALALEPVDALRGGLHE
ncbi:MAG: ABC transporter permease [Spirochaetales bacterium]|nr:ABC transporter permease [Spirochaetales bacterium]